MKECTRRNTPPHWLSCDVREPGVQPRQERDLPPVEAKAGRLVFACRTNIRVKTESDWHEEIYSAELATLFSTTRQMSVIALSAAIGQGLPYRTVPHRGTAHPLRMPAPFLVAAYGVCEAAPAAEAAPELPLLRERFYVRPLLTKGDQA